MESSLKPLGRVNAKPRRASRILLAVGLPAVCLLAAALAYLQWDAPAGTADPSRFQPPGEPGRPYIELTADRKVARIHHKDASNLSPLELVETPRGRITIQRTFSTAGALLKEEAFLNGRPVPVPSR